VKELRSFRGNGPPTQWASSLENNLRAACNRKSPITIFKLFPEKMRVEAQIAAKPNVLKRCGVSLLNFATQRTKPMSYRDNSGQMRLVLPENASSLMNAAK